MMICHASSAPDPAMAVLAGLLTCCMGAVDYGPTSCSCWRPIFDLEQAAPDTTTEAFTWDGMCEDCAHRPGSPERSLDPHHKPLPPPGMTFWCHRGMRKPRAWRHPLGIIVRADGDYYDPPIVVNDAGEPIPYRADGTAAGRCAGQEAWNRSTLHAAVADVLDDMAAAP